MDAVTQARMESKAKEAYRTAMTSLASGWCEDEGKKSGEDGTEDERPAIASYDPEAVLWLLANPAGAQDELQNRAVAWMLENSAKKDLFKLAADLVAKDIPGVVKWRRPGIKEENTAEFMRAFREGTQEVMRETGLPRKEAELEWIWRKAEEESGVKRTSPHSEASDADAKPPRQVELKRVQRRIYMRVYNNC